MPPILSMMPIVQGQMQNTRSILQLSTRGSQAARDKSSRDAICEATTNQNIVLMPVEVKCRRTILTFNNRIATRVNKTINKLFTISAHTPSTTFERPLQAGIVLKTSHIGAFHPADLSFGAVAFAVIAAMRLGTAALKFYPRLMLGSVVCAC
jgi:hypothetical protein